MLRVRRWLQNQVKRVANIGIKLPLEAGELRTAERAILVYVQGQNFGQEIIDAAMDGNATPKPQPSRRGSLRSLRPLLLDEELLCIGGRLRKANISERQKHPVILPKFHHIVDLIVKEQHEMSGHTGREHVFCLSSDSATG